MIYETKIEIKIKIGKSSLENDYGDSDLNGKSLGKSL